MWPILLGNIAASKFVSTPPRSYKMGLFTAQSFLTEEIYEIYKVIDFLQQWIGDEKTLIHQKDSYNHILHTPMELTTFLYTICLLLRRFRSTTNHYELIKHIVMNLYRSSPLYDIDESIQIDGYLHTIIHLGLVGTNSPTYNTPLPTPTELLNNDDGSPTQALSQVLLLTLVSIIYSTNYCDALRLSIYLSRHTTLVTTLTSVLAASLYGREYNLEEKVMFLLDTNEQEQVKHLENITISPDSYNPHYTLETNSTSYRKKSQLNPLPKRFERRSIEELTCIPPRICRFRGPFHFLSNMYPHPITYDGLTYAALECAYHGAKYKEPEKRAKFSRLQLPYKARAMSRNPKGIREDWDTMKVSIMRELLYIKFSHIELQRSLVSTGDAYLEEGNTWDDQFWGTVNGIGKNMLGCLLMEVRDYYKRNPSSDL